MCVWFAAVVSAARCVYSSGGLAAEEPGQRSKRGPMRSHSNAEEKAPEHPELHTCSAQECPLETAGPAGKQQQHMDAVTIFLTSWHEKCLIHPMIYWSEFNGITVTDI